ncbi:hypothetical protein SDC9_82364 [bioreactor metagenome]|uniref:Uncharacterized protein n=1 Tax=bioreactor metagenome TaxID=1076179 RepID=A0A644Z4E7_9ZZZZ
MAHRLRRLAVEQLARARKHELEVIVDLRHRAHGRARRAHRIGLVDGNRWRHALHLVHRRFIHAVKKLPRVGAERFHIAPLAFCVQRVEHKAGLARAAGPGDHGQFAGLDVHIQVLEVVLSGSVNTDQSLCHERRLS